MAHARGLALRTVALRTLALRALALLRVRILGFGALFALVAYANASGYSTIYPSAADRAGFAHSFGANGMLRLFFGVPHDLLTVGGYCAWRVGGFLAIVAGAWGLTASVASLRGEEDRGHSDLLLAAPLTRGGLLAATLAALLGGGLALVAATAAGLIAGGLAVGESLFLACASCAPAAVFAAAGALASQLTGGRRRALELTAGVLAISLVARIAADTGSGLGWLRWASPLGWSEEMRPFTGSRPLVLALPVAATAALLAVAAVLARRRDVGAAAAAGRRVARTALLGSPAALALRQERTSLGAWLVGTGVYGLIVGLLSTALTPASIPARLQHELSKLGAGSITTPSGAIGFYFLFFLLVTSLFTCAQVAAAHNEEADGRLERVLAQPVARGRWLAGRLALAAGGAGAVALTAGITAWIGATLQGAGVELPRMLEAAGNCMPLAVLFASAGFLAFAVLPRATAPVAYALVIAAFVWQLFGSLFAAPRWLLELTPFAHVALVPAQAIRLWPAAAMLAAGAACALAAHLIFVRRDLVST